MLAFEEPDTEIGELEAMQKLLWFVKEHFGVFHSKHNKQNLVIEIQGKEDGDSIINQHRRVVCSRDNLAVEGNF